MTRPSFEKIYMDLAWALSERSTCERLKVGCVITTTGHTKILAIGYNGNAHGLPNKCDSSEVGNCGCIHAETNALLKCTSLLDKHIYLTHSPCKMCAKNMIQTGNIKRVFYDIEYRNREGLDLLINQGIEVIKYDQS